MAQERDFDRYGYFDSEEIIGTTPAGYHIWDRAQNAKFWADYYRMFFTSGISPSIPDCLKIIPGIGLQVIRQPGGVNVIGRVAFFDAAGTFTLAAGNTYYHYARLDLPARKICEGLLVNPAAGTFPARNQENFYELILARIVVPAGAAQITAAMITDMRSDAATCGYVKLDANAELSQLHITANDVEDTASKAIPTKTGTRAQTLRGDGAFDTDLDGMTVGAYQIVKDAANNAAAVTINQPSAESMKFNANVYQYISGSTPQNPNNMLTGLYDNLAAGTEGSQPANFYLFFDLPAGLLTPPNAATNAQIKYRVKISRQLGGYQNGGITFALYNVASGAVTTQVPNADLVFNSSNPMPTTATIYEKTVTGLTYGNKYALKVTSSALGYYNYIYGAEIEISYTMPSRKLIDLKPNNVTLFDNYIFVREDNPSAGAVNIDVVYKPTGMIVAKITPQGLTDGAGTMLAVLQASLSNNYQLMLLQGGLI